MTDNWYDRPRAHPLEELLRRLWVWIGFGRAGR
jgi:hypothetical protein